uniref:Major capsid protein L1 n=1 Tax=Firstpapillomavirinae sp. TaxID=2809408 RepID=A0AA51GEB2_9PAPI|nr:L1 protein [Firstpapillomavirinae sp.]
MAVWLPAPNKFYIPPQPFTRVLSTDEYVTRTTHFYHAGSERLLTVGHPFYPVTKNGGKVVVPKVSPNQFRVFRVKFPDPNKFAFPDKNMFDPENERLVWAVRGVEISRGQPLGVPVTGHPLFNRAEDVENSGRYATDYKDGKDHRQNIAMDPKQTQMFIIGCTPATGEYWTRAQACAEVEYEIDDAPPIELKHTVIQDGDMGDIGFGNMDFKELQPNKSEVPLDIVQSISIYPDYVKMSKEKFGNSMFFYARREQMYARHFFARDGLYDKEKLPDSLVLKTEENDQAQKNIASHIYTVTPSGSLVSTDGQLMNRPYWIQKAQGKNNGIAWNNELFVTVLDNTRGTIFTLNANSIQNKTTYHNNMFKEYLRHVEEYELDFIMQLCKVRLTPENIAFIHGMDPRIVEDWQISLNAPQSSGLEDTYRYLESLATKCPPKPTPDENNDPWADYKFWDVDLTERMSDELDMYSLGRKFIYQSGYSSPATTSISTRPRSRSRPRVVRKRKRTQQ